MTELELKKLSRQELTELALKQSMQLENLRRAYESLYSETQSLRAELEERRIELDEAGSIAEAAMKLNGVFEAAEAASRQYLDNIRRLSERQEQLSRRLLEESKQKARKMLEEAVSRRDTICREADEYWEAMSGRLEKFYDDHKGLRELLQLEEPHEH